MQQKSQFGCSTSLIVTFLLASTSLPAMADTGVTGAGVSQDGSFSIAGFALNTGTERNAGRFTIIKNQSVKEGNVVTSICNYNDTNNLVVNGNVATFTSTGMCRSLKADGTSTPFISDNSFGISDNGEPGMGLDTVDVNILSGSGIAIPGGTLMHGNFVIINTPAPAGR